MKLGGLNSTTFQQREHSLVLSTISLTVVSQRKPLINEVNVLGYTALHRAASWGHPECLRVLVANGADLQLRNAHGERAREAAARYQKDSCVDYLDRAGIDTQ